MDKSPNGSGDYFIEPTVFTDVINTMRIAQEEIFGPVLVVIPYEDDEDAIRIANDSYYGLWGGVNGGDFERALKMAERVCTASVGVNNGMCITGDTAFGGYKASGIGREWGVEGNEEFLEPSCWLGPSRRLEGSLWTDRWTHSKSHRLVSQCTLRAEVVHALGYNPG